MVTISTAHLFHISFNSGLSTCIKDSGDKGLQEEIDSKGSFMPESQADPQTRIDRESMV